MALICNLSIAEVEGNRWIPGVCWMCGGGKELGLELRDLGEGYLHIGLAFQSVHTPEEALTPLGRLSLGSGVGRMALNTKMFSRKDEHFHA